MPDEKTQNTGEQSFEIKPEDLQAQPLPNSAVQEAKNPLNTGNGGVAEETQPAETPKVVTPVEDASPHEIKLGEQGGEDGKDLEKKLQEQLTEESQGNVPAQDNSEKTKKYLIIGISILGIAVLMFVGYKFFWPKADSAEETPTNTLSPTNPPINVPFSTGDETTPPAEEVAPPSEEMKELEEVVEDIKDMSNPPDTGEKYDEAILEEVSKDDFPSLTLPEEGTKEESVSADNKNDKILR